MAGKFEIYQDKAGKYRFRLRAANGEIVASGEAYETKAAAHKACESVQRAAVGSRVAEVTTGGGSVSGSDGTRYTQVPPPTTSLADEEPPRRRFGFIGKLTADPDLSERVDEILHAELGRRE